jgi:hypothetical protein
MQLEHGRGPGRQIVSGGGGRRFEPLGIEGVVGPSPLFSIPHQPGLPKHFQMEGQPRLGRVQRILELAHATLAGPEEFQDGEPSLVGKRVEQPGSVSERGLRGHDDYLIK